MVQVSCDNCEMVITVVIKNNFINISLSSFVSDFNGSPGTQSKTYLL